MADADNKEKKKRRIKKVAGVVAVGATVAVGAVLAAPLVIAAAGFGAGGVVAGSVAAGVQSWFGSVAAGSLFASLQSAGVLGLAASTNVAIAAGAGTVAAGTTGGIVAVISRSGKTKDRATQTDANTPDFSSESKMGSIGIMTESPAMSLTGDEDDEDCLEINPNTEAGNNTKATQTELFFH